MPKLLTIASLSLLLSLHSVCGAGEIVGKGIAPSWIVSTSQDFSKPTENQNSSVHCLFADYQKHLEKKEVYQAFATRILTAAGVQDYSQISVNFQPSYQNLVWNRLEVIRDGIVQDRLQSAKFEVIRREEGMENQLYNGNLTTYVILKDIRPNDIIFYSYTITGENPILKGRVHDFIQMSYSVPVERIHRSFIWNENSRALRWQILDSEITMRDEKLESGLRQISYEGLTVPKIEIENSTPNWLNHFPFIEISDYPDWAAFGKWSYNIYHSEEILPSALAQICDQIRTEGGNDAEKAIKVLRWVQSNVRYLGSFLGEHTHAPYPLSDIENRRFGDCKDKGIMTVAMLRHLGLDAAPALVDVDMRAKISRHFPGHCDFNHLIVNLLLDGKEYWLDPTNTFQRGTIENQYTPDYGFAFVIREGMESLSKVRPSGINNTNTDFHEMFSIDDDDGNGTLTAQTIASGANADFLRHTFASDSRTDLEESYRKFYERDYPGIKIASPISITDDEAANRITVIERYTLKDFFKKPITPDGLATASVYARSIATYFEIPDSKPRKQPLGISYPVNYKHTIDITIPKNWNVDLKKISTSLPSINYSYDPIVTDRRLTLTHRYQSLADNVSPADFSKYRQAITDANANLYFEFTYPLKKIVTPNTTQELKSNSTNHLSSYIVLAACFFVGAFIGLIICVALYFWDPPARVSSNPNLSGLGGWLILPIIGCCILPFTTLYFIGTYFFNISPLNMNLTGGDPLQNKWLIYYCSSVFTQAFALPLCFLQLILLFRRRTSFPYFFFGFRILIIFYLLLNQALLSLVDAAENSSTFAGEIIKGIIGFGIWGSYIIVSQRVRATFTQRRKPSPPTLPPPLPS